LPKIEEDGKSWLRRPKLYKRVVEPHKKKAGSCKYSNEILGPTSDRKFHYLWAKIRFLLLKVRGQISDFL